MAGKKIFSVIPITLFTVFAVAPNNAEPSKYFITYLNDSIDETFKCGVNQSRSDINLGYSKVYAGYSTNEINSVNNKFVRMANFNSDNDLQNTSFNVYVDGLEKVSEINFSLSYRFIEGKINYASDDVVLSIDFRGSNKEYKYEDLVVSNKKETGFNTISEAFAVNSNLTSNSFKITFYFKKAAALANPTTYIDIDNVAVNYNSKNYSLKGDMESLEVTSESTMVSKIDLVNDNRNRFLDYILSREEIEKFDQNTQGDEIFEKSLPYFTRYQKLPRGASEANPLGVSASNADTSLYSLYSSSEDNYFLRMRNYDGTNSETHMSNYFYDNSAKKVKNLPSTQFIYFHFSYRLFMSDAQQMKYFDKASPIMFLSTRIVSNNKTGYIYLDDLIINEEGDMTWREYSGILDCRSTSMTAYISIYYYHLMEQGDNSSFLDIDNFYLSNEKDGENYFYNGSFDFDKDNNVHELNIDGNNELLDHVISKSSDEEKPLDNNEGIELRKDSSFTYLFDDSLDEGAYQMKISGSGELNKIKFALDGNGGELYDLADENEYFTYRLENNELIVYFTSGYKFSFIDFVNNGDENIVINKISLTKIDSVDVSLADYDTFVTTCNNLFNSVDVDSLTLHKKDQFKMFEKEFQIYNQYSSQARLNDFFSRLEIFINHDLVYKADLSELNRVLNLALDVNIHLDEYNCKYADKLLFKNVLAIASRVDSSYAQSQVDEITNILSLAIEKVVGE